MKAHTVLPWHVSGGHAEYVHAANNIRVADCQVQVNPTISTREMEANAEYIVLAANSYPKLVAALKAIVSANKEKNKVWISGEDTGTAQDYLDHQISKAESALRELDPAYRKSRPVSRL